MKLEKEELDRLTQSHELFDMTRSSLAEVSININRLKSRKQQLLANYEIHEANLKAVEQEISKKYSREDAPNVKIDMASGEVVCHE